MTGRVLIALTGAMLTKREGQTARDHRRACVPRSRADLRDALHQRTAKWKATLRANPIAARQVLHHLLDGPIRIQPSDGADLQALIDGGIDLNDHRGNENIMADDCRLTEDDFREASEAFRSVAGLMV